MATLKIAPSTPGPIHYPTDEDAHVVDLQLINTSSEPVKVPCKLLNVRGLDVRYVSRITGLHVDGRFSLTDPALARQLEIVQPGHACANALILDREAIDRVRTKDPETIEARVNIPPIPEVGDIRGSVILDIVWSSRR